MNLKEFCQNTFFRSDGRFNVRKTYQWIEKNHPNEFIDILNSTSFLPEDSSLFHRVWCIINDITFLKECSVCNQPFFRLVDGEYSTTCSPKCAHKSESKQLKRKLTSLKKYGTEHPLQSSEVQKKYECSMLSKYGVRYNSQREEIKQILSESVTNRCLNEEQIEILSSSDKVQELLERNSGLVQKASKDIGVYYGTLIQRIRKFGLEKYVNYQSSESEKEVLEFIRRIHPDAKNNVKFGRKEIDILAGNIGIEYNGLYWHSFKPRSYHLDKTILCEKMDIQLLHIFEHEWLDPVKQEIWKSIICNKLQCIEKRIYARNCEVRRISDPKEFLIENHLQGWCVSKIRYGLYHNNTLISVMTFGKPRFNKNHDWELLRFCSLKNHVVVGGASKLLNHFRKEHPESIITYANRRWSNGNLYKKIGFEFVGKTSPSYFYTDGTIVLSRFQCQRHLLIGDGSEQEIMMKRGFRRIYDCGNLIFKAEPL